MGHEVVGEVVASPPGQEAYLGKIVGVAPRLGCGDCPPCNRGLSNLCRNTRVIGYQVSGGFSQFIALPTDAIEGKNVAALPPGVDPRLGALAEPLSCVINGLGLSRPPPGGSILIYGAGPMGQMFTMMSREISRDVFVVEPNAERREFALSHGASSVFAPGSSDIPEAETVISACSSPAAYGEAHRSAPAGATVNLFGGLSGGIQIDSNDLHYRQLTVHGTSGSTPEQFSEALDALVRRPELGDVITDVVGFPGLGETILSGPAGGGLHLKALLDPWS
jgi:L-iditol 2-dehydrogenase